MQKTAIVLMSVAMVVIPRVHALADDTGMAANNAWRNAGGKTCFSDHFHSGDGEGRTKQLALKTAIEVWREFTAWEYGTDWANYDRAVGKRVNYVKAAVGWTARVQALPCNSKRRRR